MITRLRILPLLIVFAVVGLALRINPIVTGIGGLVGDAQAQDAVQQGGQQAVPDQDQGTEAADTAAADAPPLAVTDPLLMSRSELDLLQGLAERRAQLDVRDRQQEMRERLLEATEQRIDTKIASLESIESQIGVLVAKHDAQENKQLESLVKVYASMKAKDAAAILQQLELEIQMKVATRMKETKMAPIMAAMTPDAARRLTVEMAQRAELPQIDG